MDNKKFLKVGKVFSFKPNIEGLESDLKGGCVYNIKVDRFSEAITLEETNPLTLPEKVYMTDIDERFINKVLNSFEKSENGFTGVMLAGSKGSGKTITAKIIANRSRLPIININKSISPYVLRKLTEKLAGVNACFLFDELDKALCDYDDSCLLQILDGTDTNGKNLIVFTCNDTDEISDYLIDRCSRIRYWREYHDMGPAMIQTILEDKLNDKKEVKSLTDFIKEHFAVCSFDNVISFTKEVNDYPKATYEELFDDMNLTEK